MCSNGVYVCVVMVCITLGVCVCAYYSLCVCMTLTVCLTSIVCLTLICVYDSRRARGCSMELDPNLLTPHDDLSISTRP